MSNKTILVIVESPGKIKKIQSYLGKNYFVTASVGHIIDLNPKSISVDIENKFKPNYTNISRQTKTITELKRLHKKYNNVLLAMDEDREGEMIAWSIAYVLKLKNPKRIVFNSITKEEILNAVKNPKSIDYDMVDAQKARRILDRIVGYKLSPLLWRNIQAQLSAGRVQSVVVRLIIDKENSIKDFISKGDVSFFKFTGLFYKDNKKKIFKTNLFDYEKKDKNGIIKGKISKIPEEKKARQFLESCIKSKFIVDNVHNKTSFRNPSPPYTTSTLQQDANRKLGFTSKRTMMAAQHLYEAGHITYMRTDSVNLSKEALDGIKKYLINKYGKKYYEQRNYSSKKKNTQEAHEAVRPTHFEVLTLNSDKKIGGDEQRLYSLIWRRTVASQMTKAEFKLTVVQITINKNKKYFFSNTIENLVFDGFLKVFNYKNEDENEDESNKNISIPKPGDELKVDKICGKQDYQKPPHRYNEASLIDQLDPKNLNIGRPSTYTTIISKIQERGYVMKNDVEGISKDSLLFIYDGYKNKITSEKKEILLGQEKNKMIPTHIGIIVNDFLVNNFPQIMDYKFTAKMEQKFDDIANKKAVWHKVLDKFYQKFSPPIEKLMKTKAKVTDKYTKKLGVDPKTGFEIIATIAKYGPIVKLLDGKTKNKMAPIKKPLTLDNIKLKDALELFQYPKEIGVFKKMKVSLNRGKYGLYLSIGNDKYSIKSDVLEKDVDIELVKKIVEEKNKNLLAEFMSDKKIYRILKGPFGDYIAVTEKKKTMSKKKKLNVKLPKDVDIKKLTLEKVEEIINNNFQNKYKKKDKKGGSTKTKKDDKKVTKKITKKPIKKRVLKKDKKSDKPKKLNAYMEAKEKARKAGAEKFVYNGKTYKKQVTKTGLVVYKS
jgi:DNA topoisomerase I